MDWLVPKFWDPRGYFFWLLAVSALCLLLERIRPWRAEQRLFRRQFGQDLFWLVFNGHFAGILVALASAKLLGWAWPAFARVESLNLLAGGPLWAQFAVFFVLKDLLEWCVHNLLHRVPWLWAFHKVHHSILELDWIGNFRFHWMEIVVYRGLTWLPLAALGVDGRVLLAIAVVSTLIGHLNHSNLDITWGPLRYVLNSPRMHVWHHDRSWPKDRARGANFGIQLSLWDWIFGTAWWPDRESQPEQQPARLGFPGIERFPTSLLSRLAVPISAGDPMDNRSVEFFERQFERQVREREFALNPFETLALEYLEGEILDLGCGLGNLSLEAARRGHQVVAVDASPTAVTRIREEAGPSALPIEAIEADLATWKLDRDHDTIVAIGLLMFFPRDRALELLREIQEHVRPGGRAIVNVLVQGTTYLGMFDPGGWCLFGHDEIQERFAGWRILYSRRDSLPAPEGTRKEFATVIAEKPVAIEVRGPLAFAG